MLNRAAYRGLRTAEPPAGHHIPFNIVQINFLIFPRQEDPIIPVIIGDELVTRKMALDLNDLGVFVSPVTFPAVGKTQARLRCSLMSSHTREDLDFVLDNIKELGRKYGVV